MRRQFITCAAILLLGVTSRIISNTAQQEDASPAGARANQSAPIDAQANPSSRKNDSPNSGEQRPATQTVIGQVLVNPPNNPPATAQGQNYIQQWKQKALTDPLVLVTTLLAFIALGQIGVYWAMLATTKRIERAYVILSHKSPWPTKTDDAGVLKPSPLKVVIQNHGKTPADILGGKAGIVIAEEKKHPTTSEPQECVEIIDQLPLMPNDSAWFEIEAKIPEDTWTKILSLEDDQHIWFVGYVDYRDRFKTMHRSGYIRRWDRKKKEFLVFDHTTKHLNYDQKLNRKERRKYRRQG